MKIGILSLVPGHNYGGILQSYALKKTLEDMGHNVCIITKKDKLNVWNIKFLLIYPIRIFKKVIGKSTGDIFRELNYNKTSPIIYQHTERFCKDHLNLLFINKFRDIRRDQFDAFVVGSDQVWRPKYFSYSFCEAIENAYLSFTKGWKVKRISYAASFGVSDWEYTEAQTYNCRKLISKFDSVSVREESGVSLCKTKLCSEAQLVCDPTMLLTRNDYESLITDSTPVSEGNLLVYCLDYSKEIELLIERVASEKYLKPFSINNNTQFNRTRIKPSVETWLRGFKDADFVITDSFHACVFSLLFRKSFVVIGNKNRGLSRIQSLLKQFGQENRLVTNYTDDLNFAYNAGLEETDSILETFRQRSKNFILNSLAE